MSYAKIGSISTGTLKLSELAWAFAYELNRLAKRDEQDPERKSLANKAAAEALDILAKDEFDETDLAEFVHKTAPGLFEQYCPPYVYFGTHLGDGADYGFWPNVEALMDDVRGKCGVIKVDAGDEWPQLPADVDNVVEVNDHGNVTLFDARSKQELWACV